MPDDKTFVDTNILVYAYDVTAGRKHEIAKGILADLWRSGEGMLSLQVLQEFFVTITRKVPRPLEIKPAKGIIEDLLSWKVVPVDAACLLDAIEIHSRHKFSLWDALILVAAIRGRASVLLSEDWSDGQRIGDLSILNPFTT
jgi:predicted nucleic acid-binding protein